MMLSLANVLRVNILNSMFIHSFIQQGEMKLKGVMEMAPDSVIELADETG